MKKNGGKSPLSLKKVISWHLFAKWRSLTKALIPKDSCLQFLSALLGILMLFYTFAFPFQLMKTNPTLFKDKAMIDFDEIWRYQDEVRTQVNAYLGDCVWDINYNLARHCVELELDRHLDDEKLERMTSQFTLTADYEGEGEHGSLFALYP